MTCKRYTNCSDRCECGGGGGDPIALALPALIDVRPQSFYSESWGDSDKVKRSVGFFVLGAAVGAAASRLLPASNAGNPPVAGIGVPASEPASSASETERASASSEGQGSGEQPQATGQRLMALRSQVDNLIEQREDLRGRLRRVEEQLRESERLPPYEFSPTAEEWQELAAASRIKYRVPCQIQADSGWRIPEPVAQALGLSPQDTDAVMAAFWRSNQRVWATVQPLCLDILQDKAAVDRLGVSGCKTLIESAATEEEPLATENAMRQVAEVRGGLREPLGSDESPSGPYQLYMALTAEGDLFEADLAESFGPEEAQHIWHSFPCSHYTGGKSPPRR